MADTLDFISKSEQEKAADNKSLFDMTNTYKRQRWCYKAMESQMFVEDEQLPPETIKALENSGMPTFTVNMITAPTEILKYFITANSPRWKSVGFDASDNDIAAINDKLIEYCYNLSNGDHVISQAVFNCLVNGVGYLFIYPDANSDNGMGDVRLGWISPFDVYVDETSRDIFYRDASYIMIAKNMTKSQLISKRPEFRDIINKATGTALPDPTYFPSEDPSLLRPDIDTPISQNDGTAEEWLPYFEVYRKVMFEFVTLFIEETPNEDILNMMKREAQIRLAELEREITVSIEEKKAQLANLINKPIDEGGIIEDRAKLEVEKAIKDGQKRLIDEKNLLESKIKDETTKIVTKIVSKDEWEKIQKSKTAFVQKVKTAVPFFEERVTVCMSIGDDTFLDFQIYDWKDYTIIPLPFMTVGNTYPISAVKPAVGKQKEINKANQLMIHHASLSSHGQWMAPKGSIQDKKEWKENSSTPTGILEYTYSDAGAPSRVLPLPLNNAFYTIQELGKSEIEYVMGIDRSAMGMSQAGDEPYRSLRARDEFSTRRIRSWMRQIFYPALELVGKAHSAVSRKVYTTHKVFRITEPDSSKAQKYEINVPIYNDVGDKISLWNDYASAKFDVKIVANSTLPTNDAQEEAKYFAYFEKGAIDDVAFWRKADIEDKEGLSHRHSLYSQLKQQVSSLEEEIKSTRGDNQTLRRQVLQGGIENDRMKGRTEIKGDVLQTQAEQINLRNKLKNEFMLELRKLKLDIEEIKRRTANGNKKQQ